MYSTFIFYIIIQTRLSSYQVSHLSGNKRKWSHILLHVVKPQTHHNYFPAKSWCNSLCEKHWACLSIGPQTQISVGNTHMFMVTLFHEHKVLKFVYTRCFPLTFFLYLYNLQSFVLFCSFTIIIINCHHEFLQLFGKTQLTSFFKLQVYTLGPFMFLLHCHSWLGWRQWWKVDAYLTPHHPLTQVHFSHHMILTTYQRKTYNSDQQGIQLRLTYTCYKNHIFLFIDRTIDYTILDKTLATIADRRYYI